MRRVRVRSPETFVALALFFLVATPVFPAGFSIFAQGAKASGMGLAFTAIADDPSAVFYNPAGLGWQKHFSVQAGGSLLSKVEGDFEGANPFPGTGFGVEEQRKTSHLLPTFYAVVPLTSNVNFGLGIFAPYVLGFRWEDAEQFSGRFIAQNAVIRSADINPVLSFQLAPSFAIAAGADYRLSKVQLERNQAAINPFTQSVVDVAHIKLDSDIQDNTGWGWNAGFLWKPVGLFSLGAAYRSSIEVDYEGEGKFTQRLTGNTAFDAAVAASIPQGKQDVAVTIEFPATVNLGAAINLPADFTLSLEADWTEWSSFDELFIDFDNPAIPDLDRLTRWDDSWAYRAGLEKRFGSFAVRAGFYYDESPQPLFDVGPILADADRNAYTLGIGYSTERWGVDISDIYIDFDQRDTRGEVTTDNFSGRYSEAANLVALSFRLSF
ncbi:MAG TPA: outer membrane protein transport protein [Thermoanaerobaculia bacterium]